MENRACIEACLNQINFPKARKKQWKDQKREMKADSKTKSQWMKETQKVFNAFIRARDKGKFCISCPRPLAGKYDAGHYFPSSYPMLRLDEDNVHGQCVQCNRDKHGNLAEYKIRLTARIGQERFDALEQRRLTPKHYTIPELIELKEFYKHKLKQL